jgi:hypothetical protein
MKVKYITPIKRSFENHIKFSLKRFPSLYHGDYARLMAINHMLFRYGTGIQFLKDGSIFDVYEETYVEWRKRRKETWLKDKAEWEKRVAEDRGCELYKIYPPYKAQKDADYERDRPHFEKFNPYSDLHSWMLDGGCSFYPKITQVDMSHNIHRSDSCPINSYPNNIKTDVVKGALELLEHMIETKQDIKWAKSKRNELEELLKNRKK